MERFNTEREPKGIPEKQVTHKISPESEEYSSHLEASKNYNADAEHCFASSLLEKIENNERLLKLKRGETSGPLFLVENRTEEELLTKRNNLAEEIRTEFLSRLKNEKSRYYAREVFVDALENSDIKIKINTLLSGIPQDVVDKHIQTPDGAEKLIRLMFPERTEEQHTADLLTYAFENNLLDNELWLEIVRNHKTKFLEKSKEFDENIKPEFQADFLASITDLSYRGILPLSIGRITKTLEMITVKLDDAIEHSFDEKNGSYDSEQNLALIGSRNFRYKKILYKIYVHEIMHALSGKTVRVEVEGDYESMLKPDRVGLRIINKFRWLNEAITESVTQLMYDKGGDSYVNERKLLDYIIQKSGVPLQDFYNAYFEHYNPEEKDTDNGAISNWKKLNQKLNSTLGERFLVHLDDEIKRAGIKKVLESFQE